MKRNSRRGAALALMSAVMFATLMIPTAGTTAASGCTIAPRLTYGKCSYVANTNKGIGIVAGLNSTITVYYPGDAGWSARYFCSNGSTNCLGVPFRTYRGGKVVLELSSGTGTIRDKKV